MDYDIFCYSLLSTLTTYSVEDILQVLIVFAVESLELDFALLFPERYILLRVLPILVVLATSSEKDSESLYKRVKINRMINIFKVASIIDNNIIIVVIMLYDIYVSSHFIVILKSCIEYLRLSFVE